MMKIFSMLAMVFLFATTAFAQSDIESTVTTVFSRINKVNFDDMFQQMSQQGKQKQKGMLAFGMDGALFYSSDLKDTEDNTQDWTMLDRDSGITLLPFSLEFASNGEKRISFSAASLKNLNQLANADSHVSSVLKILDQVDLLTFAWDDRMSFSNIRSFDFQVAKITLRAGPGKQDGFALKLTGAAGLASLQQLDQVAGTSTGFKTTYNAGIEYRLKASHGQKLTLESGADGGYQNLSTLGNRNYLYEQNTVDYSVRVNSEDKTPASIGMKMTLNVPIYDQISLKAGGIDETKFNNQLLKGTVYIRF